MCAFLIYLILDIFPFSSLFHWCFSLYDDKLIWQIFEIIGFVYQYFKLLRQVSPQEWIFKELQNIGNMEFRFAEEQPQDDYAAELSGYVSLLASDCLFHVNNLRPYV